MVGYDDARDLIRLALDEGSRRKWRSPYVAGLEKAA